MCEYTNFESNIKIIQSHKININRNSKRIESKMIVFKAIIIGLVAWQIILLLKRRKENRQNGPTYIILSPDQKHSKEPSLLIESEPPPSYYTLPTSKLAI